MQGRPSQERQIELQLTDSPDSLSPDDIADFHTVRQRSPNDSADLKTVRQDSHEQATVGSSSESEGEMGNKRRSKRGTQGQTPKRFLPDLHDDEPAEPKDEPLWMGGQQHSEESFDPGHVELPESPQSSASMASEHEDDEDVVSSGQMDVEATFDCCICRWHQGHGGRM